MLSFIEQIAVLEKEIVMFILLKIILIIILADFISGFVHWLEDAYAKPEMMFFGEIARENLLHHDKPRDFLKKSWWQSSYDLIALGLVILVVSWLAFGIMSVWLVLLVVLSVNANQIHKWAHQNRQERPWIISKLQDWNIVQGARQHGRHHRGEKNTYYCVITNVLNPVLEKMKFWIGLERVILMTTGVQRRQDGV